MNKIILWIRILQKLGISVCLRLIYNKLFFNKINNYEILKKLFQNKNGIEIGGPTNFFKKTGVIPIYNIVASLDTVNPSNQTIWEGDIQKGFNFVYDDRKSPGYQYILDGISLQKIHSEKYDFLLSCNVLEHIANPFKAISEWKRIVKKGGVLLLILPRKESNFDHKRKITSFKHLVNDYKNDMDESDLTHLPEIIKDHDLSLDPAAGSKEQFIIRSKNNYENRSLHHHVFDMDLLIKIYNYFSIKIIAHETLVSDYILVGKKS